MKWLRPTWLRRLTPGIVALGMATNISATTNYWTVLKIDPAIYDTPYRISLFNPQNGEDGERLWSQTQSIFIYGVGVVGFIALLPQDFTRWNPGNNIFRNWGNNVGNGPEWDRNKWYINYIGHPYFGGVYYQLARKSGYRQWDSFVYSFLMSTFYWEYGVEAFAEEPSIQDLVVHPVLGWVWGEWMFQTERRIRDGGGTVAGSTMLGNTALFFLDPIDAMGRGLNRLTGRRLIESGYGYFSYAPVPTGNATDHQLYLHMRFPIGGASDREPEKERRIEYRNDPVDTGIVGVSIGTGHTFLDDNWGVDDGNYTKVSMGLYFTHRFSTRLAYAQGHLNERATGRSVVYENYSLDAQYYLSPDRTLRPYLSAGFGEQLWDKDREQRTFQWNGGLGLHYRLHRKWSLQADWIHYYSPSKKNYDHNFNVGVVYRFGRGEHNDW